MIDLMKDLLILASVCASPFILLPIFLALKKMSPGSRQLRVDKKIEALSRARLDFLYKAFSILPEDLSKLHFDGYVFDFRKPIPITEVKRIELSHEYTTTVRNKHLPHDIKWRYQRVDGGPDRRYNNNRPTFVSKKCYLRISTTQSNKLNQSIYIYPHDSIQSTIEKFKPLLQFSKLVALERVYGVYEKAYQIEQDIDKQITDKRSRIDELNQVLTSITRLSASDDDVENVQIQHRAQIEIDILRNEIHELIRKRIQARQRQSEIIRRVDTLIRRSQDRSVVDNFSREDANRSNHDHEIPATQPTDPIAEEQDTSQNQENNKTSVEEALHSQNNESQIAELNSSITGREPYLSTQHKSEQQ